MQVITKPRRSNSYRFTVLGTADELPTCEALKYLKSNIRHFNKNAVGGIRKTIAIKPRVGRGSQFAHLYRTGGPLKYSARAGSYKPEHGSRFDVYVYERHVEARKRPILSSLPFTPTWSHMAPETKTPVTPPPAPVPSKTFVETNINAAIKNVITILNGMGHSNVRITIDSDVTKTVPSQMKF